ncbi:MAG: HAD family hydrolase [Promethearchaeota archaeon]
MSYHLFLFDIDNCLIHIPESATYFDSLLVKTLQKLSARIPERQIRNKLWEAGQDYKFLLKQWKVTKIDQFWEEYDKEDFFYRKKLLKEKKITLFPDVRPVLDNLLKKNDKVKLAIISNTADYIVEYMLKEFNLKDYFHHVFALSYEFPQEFAKPSPLGIKITLEQLGFNSTNAEQTIMIGDSKIDIIAAKRAQIDACLILREGEKYSGTINQWAIQPDYIINNLWEILEFS